MNDHTPTTPDEDPDPTVHTPSASSEEREIGPYRLLQKIGEGGMGEVWMAEQVQPIRRRVALKIIKRGMDSREVVARFEAERQALALMNHDCVAKVYDAGTTPRGRPFFVMEYVQGVPIIEYCDRHRLDLRARMRLFTRVCEGVQHAHQKAIIHRDLKPNNVLVTEQDGVPLPKIIDFGVAKATSQKLTEQTMFTQIGVLIGTPEYMSPEQAELTGEDVDTRTDVYSLGVILYELLIGDLPFDSKELRGAGFDGIRRIIREQEPQRPSTRFSSLGDRSTISAAARRASVPVLRSVLRGDLDWITMKALEKDRGRRYESPLALARDLERHLSDEPVEARPPTLAYRAGRFIRRNRVAVSFAAVLVVLILGAGASLAVLYSRSVESERRATREAETAQRSLEFMTNLFRVFDPFESAGEPVTAMDLLDVGTERVVELEDEPEVQLSLMSTLGDVYRELGDWNRARALLEDALERQIEVSGRVHADVATRLRELGYNETLAENYEQAEEYLTESTEIWSELGLEDEIPALDTRHLTAFLYVRSGRHAEAEPIEVEILAALDRVEPEPTERRADYLHVLGWALAGQSRIAEAREAYEKSIALRRKLSGDHNPAIGWSLNMLGRMLARQSDPDLVREGIDYLERAKAVNERVFDGEHVEIGYNWANMAHGYMNLGDVAMAERCLREAIAMASRFLDDRHGLGSMKRRLAVLLRDLERYDEAEGILLEHLAQLSGLEGVGDRRTEAEELLRSVYVGWGREEAFDEWRSSQK